MRKYRQSGWMKKYKDAVCRFARTAFFVFFVFPVICALPLQAAPVLFKSTETPYSDLSRVGKWTNVLQRYAEEKKEGAPCSTKDFSSCKYPEWKKFIESVRGLDKLAQLTAVNKQMNKSRYTLDNVNWGVEDYWATPGQFLARSGDCEDYAITKYMTLRELGWSTDDMRIVVVQDLNLNVGHAILAVYVNDKIMILDNQINNVVESDRIQHYRPIYSVNEKMWWRHVVK